MSTADRTYQFNQALECAQRQVRGLVERYPHYFPMYTSSGRWKHGGELWTDWCGGFLAGMLWLFYARTGEKWWRSQAERYSELLKPRRVDRQVHDLGFIFSYSYGRGYELTGDESRMDVVAEAGTTLAGRFQDNGQYLASFLGPHSLFIDIMMNVPIIFAAADWLEREGRPASEVDFGDDALLDAGHLAGELRRMAMQHCWTSQRYLVRPDGSTAHEAVFDTATGNFLRESTQQGLRPDSCWSRGLAWAIYGFGMAYRHTREPQFLNTARRCAAYYLEHVPEGGVPHWDFHVPEGPDQIWDSSAAAIAASGLLLLEELGQVEGGEPTDQPGPTPPFPTPGSCREAALRILDTLCSDRFLASSRPGCEGVLLHAVYHFHKKLGVDESVMWGDHFFVEALCRAMKLLA